MTAYDELYSPIQTYRYHFRCNHGEDDIAFSSDKRDAYCPQCSCQGRLIGYDRMGLDGSTTYTPMNYDDGC
jgi:hypothetical protein